MKLVAVSYILYDNKQYCPGDALPNDMEMGGLWLAAGSAVEEQGESKPVVKTGSVNALTGLTGDAVNAETNDNLVGRVPLTERRKRK